MSRMEPRLSKAADIEKFISLCLGSPGKEEREEISGIIKGNLDWVFFLQLVSKKGVAALTYQHLRFYQPANPAEKKNLEGLTISYLSISAKNSYYWEELKKVISILMRGGIAVIPLKGITLSQRLYGDITSRDESVDFDLLVREADKEKAKALLEGIGYIFMPPDEIKEWQWAYRFSHPKTKMIELHWDITMMVRSRERIEGLWEGAEPVEREGASYYDFKPEELLLYLSAHLVNSDSFRTLRAVADINRLLQKYAPEINWQRLADKAKKWRLSGSLYAALRLNQDFFVPRFPKELLAWLGLSSPKRIFIRAFANKNVILKEGLRRAFLDKFLAYIFFEIAEARCLKDCLIILKRAVFPPRQAMGQRSYILRIFKGIAKLVLPKPA